MSRVLLVCPEPLGHGQPAGIGIRFVEIARVLRGDGHTIAVLSPDGGSIDGCRAETISPQTLLALSEESDVAVVQGHVANDYFAHARPIPTVVDLYDPFIVENLHYFPSRGGEVFQHDHATLLNSLMRGDFFLCASEAQRLFYLGLLLAVGRLNPIVFEADPHIDSLLQLAPFGVQPEREEVPRDLEAPAILFGGIYDWYDPLLAIDAVALVRREIPGATLTFTRHPNPGITPQGKLAEAIEYAKPHPWVRFEPWVAYEKRGEFFDRFAMALLTFPQSLETDLSMRTRVYDYMWGGLPIVTSSAPGTNEVLTRYGAGSVVCRTDTPVCPPGNPTSVDAGSGQTRVSVLHTFANEIVAILRSPERYASMRRGARELVRDHQWPRTLAPLREFCASPRVAAAKEAFAVSLHVPEQRPSLLQRIRRRIGAPS